MTNPQRAAAGGEALRRIPLQRIRPNPSQPRRSFPPESIERLADSIRLHGLLSPLLVRACGDGQYQLIAGERRLRALRQLGASRADALVLAGDACDCALIALVENLQREELHFLDVAAACRRILDRHPITQERLALSLSCSPSALANRLRLLKLPESVQAAVRRGGLSERHARALLKLPREADQLALAQRAAEGRMSVKQLEACVEQRLRPAAPAPKAGPLLRDNRIVINALMDTVRQLARIGVPVVSRVEDGADYVEVIVRIPAATGLAKQEGADRSVPS